MGAVKPKLSWQLLLSLLPRLQQMPVKWQLLPIGAGAAEISLIVAVAAEGAEPAEAAKIKISAKTAILIIPPPLPTPNPTKRVPDTLTGPQTQPVAAIGLRGRGRPTAPTHSSAAGPPSLHQEIKIEKLAC